MFVWKMTLFITYILYNGPLLGVDKNPRSTITMSSVLGGKNYILCNESPVKPKLTFRILDIM